MKYQLYGLKLDTFFKMPILNEMPFEGEPDVVVKTQTIEPPKEGLEKTVYKPWSVYNKDFFYLDVIGIAKYQVNGATEVLVDKYEDANWQDAVTFFFDTVFSVVLLQNNLFVFHASAIAIDNKAYLFCSQAGNGKSSLASVMIKEGATVVEDDRCLLRYDEELDKFVIKNQIPFMDVWSDVSKLLQKDHGLKPSNRIRKNIQKIRYKLNDKIACMEETPVEKLFLIGVDNKEDEITVNPVKGMAKINVAKSFTHLQYMISVLGKTKEHFKLISEIINKTDVMHISRSRLTKINKFKKFVLNEITGRAAE